ncbi:Putative HC-toxin efflux carrier TOXA [Talaromyces islandicus]|uniref:Putative HC-toxin efflux carrier TOXA n=1 Tax=Talaromyces islandicus TaxID=28573 RepID=A0A0U1M315_TALIS|nr:Putative HC-toxin efflux carrier TOXA [Talaromyces islandicus]
MAESTDINTVKPQGSSPPKAVDSSHLQSWRLVIVIGTLCLGAFLYGLDANIIGTAIPRITTDFKSLPAVAWYGASYLLTVTAFQPFFGNLYKFFNAKIVYLASLLIFEAGSIVCASARTSDILIFGRALLGFGASGLLQGALAIIGMVVPLEKVPLFQGIVISGVGISICVAPIVGGALTQYASWRWCFWINVPVGFFAIIIIFLFVPLADGLSKTTKTLPLRQKLSNMDPVGTILFLSLVCCLLLALTWGGQQYAWKSSKIIGLFVGFGILLLCFCFWDWKQGDKALIPLRVLRKRSVCMGAIILFDYGVLMYVYGYYLPMFFQTIQGASATESGVRYIAMMIPQIVTLAVTGAIVSKWGYYIPYMIAGDIIASVGSGLLTTIGLTTPTVRWAAYLVLTGIGVGMASQLPYTALQVVLDSSDIATGNAIAVFSSQLGGALGLAIGQNLLINGLRRELPRYTTAVTVEQVLAAGASGLPKLASSPAVLEALRRVYTQALRDIFILGLACACLTLLPSCATEWLNITHESQRRKELQEKSNEKGGKVQPQEERDVKGVENGTA